MSAAGRPGTLAGPRADRPVHGPVHGPVRGAVDVRAEYAALRRVLALLHLDRRRVTGAVLAGSAGLGSAVALAAVSAWLIARASQMPPVLDLTVAVVSVRAFGISRAVFRYVERLVSHEVALRGVADLREEVYVRLAAARTDAVVGLRRGDVLARTGADVDAVGDLVVRGLLPAAISAVVGVGTVVLVAALLPAAALVLLLALLLAGVVSPWLTVRAARISELAALAERAELSATAMTAVDSAAELEVSGRTSALLSALRESDARLARAADRAARPAAAAAGINLLAMGVAVLGALLLGIPATTAGVLMPVELAVVVLVPLAAFEATGMLPAAAVQLVRSTGAAVRVVALLDDAEPDGATDGGPLPAPAAGPTTGPTTEPATGPAAGAPHAAGGRPHTVDGRHEPDSTLTARELTCGWPGGPAVATGLDLAVAPGRCVVLVGRSGVGKTTVLLTLAGLIPPQGGSVLVAGRAPWGQDREWVSRHLVLTAEDAHVFDTSVLENLRVARGDLTPAQARAALDAAGLGPWLDGLPEGVETRLGADGTTISGGERRRLLLARALVSPAPVLLLDEPAEHLDAAAADALVRDLLHTAAKAERGLVLVTHRLSALGPADEVIVLGHEGAPASALDAASGAAEPAAPPGHPPAARVVARGRHDDLVERLPAYAWALAQERTELRAPAGAPSPGEPSRSETAR